MANATKTLRLPADLLDCLTREAGVANTSVSRELSELLSVGYARRMISNAQTPLAFQFLAFLSDQGLRSTYRDFFEASLERQGLQVDPPARCALVELPRGGEWERRGMTGWALVARGDQITPDGTIERGTFVPVPAAYHPGLADDAWL